MDKSPQQLQAELERVARAATNISTRYAAHMMLHKAACLSGDHKEMQMQRDNLHTLLDALLDNAEVLQHLLNQAGHVG